MIVDKFHRFFRTFQFRFYSRHQDCEDLSLFADAKKLSVFQALKERIKAEKALVVQSNGDIIELMEIENIPNKKCLALLFHLASPSASDPMYRKVARAATGKRFTVRPVDKKDGEVQSISSHLIIRYKMANDKEYYTALEEVPGISMTAIAQIISRCLNDYKYEFKRGKMQIETYCVFKCEGIKSETMTSALKSGQINYVKFTRPASSKMIDSSGMFEPMNEELKLRVTGNINSKNWSTAFENLVKAGKKEGWKEFNVDVSFDDARSKTVSVDRDDNAKEILFVRSTQVNFPTARLSCENDINDVIVDAAIKLAKK